MIVVEDVHKRYMTERGVGEWVLKGVSFVIPANVSVGLVGRNGAGKSTLLRLIGGVDVPSKGHIERRCRVSWPMGFGGGLQGSLTGRQNAKFVCRIHGHENDIRERLEKIEEFAELGRYFDEPVNTYSSGMRSRLNFALSLAFDFDVYISDEITATGDAAFKAKAKAAFRNLADHSSIIMVSHSESTLKDFCTAGIWLHEGGVHWFDDIADAIEAYRGSVTEDGASVGTGLTVKRHPVEARLLRFRNAIATITAGMNGKPAVLSEKEGGRLGRQARRLGIKAVSSLQATEQGYQVVEGAAPLYAIQKTDDGLREYFYDLESQCTKRDGT